MKSIIGNAVAEADKEKLKHGLKILVETEKQLRTSKDQSTWLTAALLQFNTGESLPPTNMNPLEAPEKVSYSRGRRMFWMSFVISRIHCCSPLLIVVCHEWNNNQDSISEF